MMTRGRCLRILAALLFLSAASGLRAREDFLSNAEPAVAANSWRATSTANAPSARFIPLAVWTGSKMIIWGGGASDRALSLGDGRLYDPVTNTWKAVSTVNAPSAREAASAVWTGSRMIVWGGAQFKGEILSVKVLGDGGIYDPETDTWTKISLSGAPSPRCYHTAVWTGSEMIVWGGSAKAVSTTPANFGDVNTGAIYEPISNTWRPVSTTSAPSSRDRHTALWTGTHMLVWGGDDGKDNDLATGGIYDPGTDTWVATSTVGAPAGRDDHAGVWNGSEMLVWGGYAGTHVTNTGGVFDPLTNSWKPTSRAVAPSARAFSSAIAFRGRLIVFGGWDGAADLNTGGIYDPETDSWTATPTAGAPSKRAEGSVVSTGSAIIVWGGDNTGGIYTPPDIACSETRECIVAPSAPEAATGGRRP
jgi:N-acetylneuraminic acid mutarotase